MKKIIALLGSLLVLILTTATAMVGNQIHPVSASTMSQLGVGRKYQPPLTIFTTQQREHKVIAANFWSAAHIILYVILIIVILIILIYLYRRYIHERKQQ